MTRWIERHVILLVLCLLVPAAVTAEPPVQVSPRGARYQDLQVGNGAVAGPGDIATIQFIGWLDDNGRVGRQIHDTRKDEHSVSFVVGTDRVMPGWNEAVIGMRVGGRRMIHLPPALGYGARALRDLVPAQAALVFQIDLVALEKR